LSFLSLAFATPAVLIALAALPLIWWLLKLTPPRPRTEVFPPLKILASVLKREETPSKSPWWLTLLRMVMAALVILALADPVLNPRSDALSGDGPLMLVIDNSWSTTTDWDRRRQTAEAMIDDAAGRDIPVSIVFTADPLHDAVPTAAATAREKLAAAAPQPLRPDRERALAALGEALNGQRPGTLVFLSDGISASDEDDTITAMGALNPAELRLIEGDGAAAVAVTGASNGSTALTVTASRLRTAEAASLVIDALDSQGRTIASGTIDFPAGTATANGEIAAPFELRNDFARVSVAGIANAGAVHLLDDGFRRRRVALLAGEVGDEFQPLLSPLYYINRALQPFADLIEPESADLSASIPILLQQNPSAIIMADIGRLPADTYDPVQRWVSNGGTLIRFAGPRLAAAPAADPLVPVVLRQGERALGGALSWAEPQPLSEFPNFGPFAGMPRPADVMIRRQVLAEPTPDLAERTWASLADGTPLVTVRESGRGRIVLFHVTAEATWSNLPISGDFVEMLRRVVQLSPASGTGDTNGSPQANSLAPWRLLTERGALTAETGNARPIAAGPNRPQAASFDNPPGLYGSEDGFVALNLLPPGAELHPLDRPSSVAVTTAPLLGEVATPLKPTLLALALLLLFADAVIVLFMGGAFARLPKRAAAAAVIGLAFLAAAPFAPEVHAQDAKPGDEQILERLDNTHLAYVITGEPDVDRLSEQGLTGLSDFLTYRTTLEPAAPVGLDISKDELSFYPIIFWPISASAPMPSAAAISRIDAYMRAGGTVLFDTRDQFSALGDDGPSPNGERLQAILANIDIPPLEPVPSDHVLTRSFYLLSGFPGRYSGSPLWVEARQEARNSDRSITSSGDGVTPLMITGNDLLGAWAIDDNGAPVMPTVPADEMQREMSYRAGVNIMMYMLTGNYKADQVHVPALLERLGQ
jgi:N-terminal double-transmembrane domain